DHDAALRDSRASKQLDAVGGDDVVHTRFHLVACRYGDGKSIVRGEGRAAGSYGEAEAAAGERRAHATAANARRGRTGHGEGGGAGELQDVVATGGAVDNDSAHGAIANIAQLGGGDGGG